jgi:hypothetical protein
MGEETFRVPDVGLQYLLMIVPERLTPFWKQKSIAKVWKNW